MSEKGDDENDNGEDIIDKYGEKTAEEVLDDGQRELSDMVPKDNPIETTDNETNIHEQEIDDSMLKTSDPMPTTMANLEATATVKFVLMPSGQVATLAFRLGQTLEELKDYFARELRIPKEMILLMFNGNVLENTLKLAELGVGPNGTIQLEMQSVDPVNTPIPTFKTHQDDYHMPDVIAVRVEQDNGEHKDVNIEIVRQFRKKPFLGGYRNKETGVEYHHAASMTMPKPRVDNGVEKFRRQTQTYQLSNKKQQASEDTSTQMTGIGLYITNEEDLLLTPKKYTTSDEIEQRKYHSVIVLQKYWRRWLAIQKVQKLKIDYIKRMEWEKQEEERKRKEKEERVKRELMRRMNPKRKEDFDLLYAALEKWRREEEDHIDSTLTGAERKAALCQLLDQETQLISSIIRHQSAAGEEWHLQSIQALLDKASSPKRWKGPDGNYTQMDTPYTIRARELKDIYASITSKYVTRDERLDSLLSLKQTVKEHDCDLTREIIDLIDREADLVMRGVKNENLEGLRARIATLFLQYIRTPLFNPEIGGLLKVPQDPNVFRKKTFYCKSCCSYKPSTEFEMGSNARTPGLCRSCQQLDNDARMRQDFAHYRSMLRNLRAAEREYKDDSKIAFILQEEDLRYLVEKIWGAASALSGWNDLSDLLLVRWIKYDHWSPWNCVLLTKDESAAHNKLENLEETYGIEFVQKIEKAHVLAKNYFDHLPKMANLVSDRISENKSLNKNSAKRTISAQSKDKRKTPNKSKNNSPDLEIKGNASQMEVNTTISEIDQQKIRLSGIALNA